MKATIEKRVLSSALSQLTSVTERRNTIPVLANVLIEALESGAIRLTTTDLDVQLSLAVPGSVASPGAVTTPVHLLSGVVKELNDGSQIEIVLEAGRLGLVSGRSRHNLVTLPAADFPKIRDHEWAAKFDLPARLFTRLATECGFAQNVQDASRPYLMGVFVHSLDGELRAAATDGHRLASIDLEVQVPDAFSCVTLPSKTVALLDRLVDGREGSVTVRSSVSKIEVDAGEWCLTSKLVEGSYPDYTRVLPAPGGALLRVSPEALAKAARRIGAIASEKTRVGRFDISRDKVIVSLSSPDCGEAHEEVPADWNGSDLSIGFNIRYLLDVLGAVESDAATIQIADAKAPTLFTGARGDARWVLMPCHV